MAKRIKDTDYLAISARIRAMEGSLLTRERMEQILDAIPGDASDRSRGFAYDLFLALLVDDLKKRLGIGKEAACEQTKA